MSNVVEVQNSDDFVEIVINSDKPVLVDFWAEWCGPCKQLAPLVEAAAEEFKNDITVCKMDVDANRETAAEYGIRSCLLYTSPSPRDRQKSRMPSSA